MKSAATLWIIGAIVAVAIGGTIFVQKLTPSISPSQVTIPTEPVAQSVSSTPAVTAASTTSPIVSTPVTASSTTKTPKTTPPQITQRAEAPTTAPTTIVPSTTPDLVQATSKKPILSSSTIEVGDSYLLTLEVTDAHWPNVPEPKNRPIATQAVVALFCHDYKGTTWKGSGNIIHPEGYILTNRHVGDDAKYCEVAMPDASATLPLRSDIANIASVRRTMTVAGWRPYKATRFFVPNKPGLSEAERDGLDFAIMKITQINDKCELFQKCDPLPTSFPYNPVSDFHIETSTAPAAFPIKLEGGYTIPLQPYELLMYGYPSQGTGGGDSHLLRGNIGYAVAYIAGDQAFSDDPFAMVMRTFDATYGGASGSGMFYNGHIIGLIYAHFSSLQSIQLVLPMPLISRTLKENNLSWILARD